MQNLLGFVRSTLSKYQPDQQGTDRYPRELVPIEKGKSEQRRFKEIVKRHPEQTDERQQQ
jgi:hypothetical protein